MGSKKSSSTTTTSPWGPAQGALESILSNANNLFNSQGGINADFVDKEIADLTPEMQNAIKNMLNSPGIQGFIDNAQDAIKQGVSGIGQASGILANLAQGGGNITAEQLNKEAEKLYDSDLVKSQKEQLQQSVQEGVDANVQRINDAAGRSGGMGSSRAGVAEGAAIEGGQKAMATGSAQIENAARQSAYQQALTAAQQNQQTQYGAAGQLGQLGTSAGQLGVQIGGLQGSLNQSALQGAGILQQYQQNVLNNKWFNQTGQQNMGWDMLGKYLNIAGSIGGMGGTSNSTGKGSSLIESLSDARLKDNIVMVEEERVTEDGHPVPALYCWVWNKKAIDLFHERGYTHVPPAHGAIAQELDIMGFERFVHRVPTEVEGLDGEVLTVDYDGLFKYFKEIGVEL